MYLHCCRYCGDAVCDCLSGYHACQGCRFCPAGEDDDEDARAEHDCGEDICVCLDLSSGFNRRALYLQPCQPGQNRPSAIRIVT
jgi:hypothetical protein